MLKDHSLCIQARDAMKQLQLQYFNSRLNIPGTTSYILPTVAIESFNTQITNNYAMAMAELLGSVNPIYNNQEPAFWGSARMKWLFNQGLLMGDLAYVYRGDTCFLCTFSRGVLMQMHSGNLLDVLPSQELKVLQRLSGFNRDSFWYSKLKDEFEHRCRTVFAVKLTPQLTVINGTPHTKYIVKKSGLEEIDIYSDLIVPTVCRRAAMDGLQNLLDNDKPVQIVTGNRVDYYTTNPTLVSKYYGDTMAKGIMLSTQYRAETLLAVKFSATSSSPTRELDLALIDRISVVDKLPADLKRVDLPVESIKRYMTWKIVGYCEDSSYSLLAKYCESLPEVKRFLTGRDFATKLGLTSGVTASGTLDVDAMIPRDKFKYVAKLIFLASDRHLLSFLSDCDAMSNLRDHEVRNAGILIPRRDGAFALSKNNSFNIPQFKQEGKHLWEHTGDYKTSVSKETLRSILAEYLCEISYVTKSNRLVTLVATNNIGVLKTLIPDKYRLPWETTHTKLIGLRDLLSSPIRVEKLLKNSDGTPIDLDNISTDVIKAVFSVWHLSDTDFMNAMKYANISVGEYDNASLEDTLYGVEKLIGETKSDAHTFYTNNPDNVLLRCADALCQEKYLRSVTIHKVVKVERLKLATSYADSETWWNNVYSRMTL